MWRVAVAATTCCGAGGYLYAKYKKGDQCEVGQGSLQDRFKKFASVGANTFMTVEDFISSCCSSSASSLGSFGADPYKLGGEGGQSSVPKDMKDFFDLVDANGDGLLSFPEYCLLFSLISVKDETFRTAFHMFDRDENGALDFNEFKLVMRAVSVDPTAQIDLEKSSLVKRMFGQKLERTLTFDRFLQLIEQLRWDVRGIEFRQFQAKAGTTTAAARRGNHGAIRLSDLRTIFFGQGDVKDEETKIVVPWASYAKLFDVIRESEDIEKGLTILTEAKSKADGDGAGGGVSKVEFARVLRAANLTVTPQDIDILYRLFDADASGTIDPEEFGRVCRLRNSFFASYEPKYDQPERNTVQQFFYCMQQRV